jgi:hypothetical protein
MTSRIDQLVTSKSELVNRNKTSNKLTSYQIKERALLIAAGLTSTVEPHDMTAWYCKAFKTLGEQKYSALASMARQGRSPKGLFAYLIKQELK